MKITRKFMIYVICTGTVLCAMAMVFLYSSLTHIDALEHLIKNNFLVDAQTLTTSVDEIAKDKNRYHEILAPLFFLIATAGLLIIIIQLIYISKRIVAPITEAAEFSYKLAKGQFPPRMNFNNRQCDEIISLVKSLNFMRDRMQSSINKLKMSHKREKDVREEVEKANRIQSDFLANVSPNLRNPLNSIKGWTQLMLQDAAAGKTDINLTGRLQMINSSIEMLDNQITGLLDISELHSEHVLHNLTSFNPMEFLNELVDYSLIRFKDRDLAMENHFSSTVPDKIMTDRELLFSVLDVIICAIIDVTNGKIKNSYGCNVDGSLICFWIHPELDSNELDTLVKQFEQYSTYPVNKLPTIKGASILNLLIAASRAKKLHGEFKIETHGNKHTFKICFNSTDIETDEILGRTPLVHAASNVKKERYEYDYNDELLPDEYPEPYDLNVLIADHDRDNTKIIAEFLEDAGCRTVLIHNSESCRNIMDGDDYDVTILGRRMAEQLIMTDAKEALSSKPIIVTASFLNEMQRRKLIAKGVNHFFLKPLDFNKLKLTVAALGITAKNMSDK
jgi:signal transduction histidine kinase/CheY-like chemotaxis protein